MLPGIIDFLISNHPIVEKLRNRVIFKIIPMINPDGVVLGNFRYSKEELYFEDYVEGPVLQKSKTHTSFNQ